MTTFLQRFVNVRREEIGPILLAALFFFSILTALMVLRPAREALGLRAGIDAVRWLFMGTLVVTFFVNPVFGWLVSKFRRITFVAATYLFFAGNLLVFYGLLVVAPQAIGETSGLVFYIWMSVFNLFITMVFWALMADRFSLEQSKRLFGVIAAGGTMGAIFGSWLASILAEPLGTPALLLVASGFLALALGAAWSVTRFQPDQSIQAAESDAGTGEAAADGARPAAAATPASVQDRSIIGGSAWEGFRATFKSPYLLGIAAYVLILAVMATFLYFTRLQMVAALGDDMDMRTTVFAQIDLATQVATLILQVVVAGHVMKRLGVTVALALVPITIALGFIGLAIVGSLAALVIFEAVFRATQRAIQRPARETLFTVVSREDKYKSKAFIDTLIYRGGDAVGAQTEGLLGRLGMGLAGLATVAVPIAIVWAGLGIWLGRSQQKLAAQEQAISSEEGVVKAERAAR